MKINNPAKEATVQMMYEKFVSRLSKTGSIPIIAGCVNEKIAAVGARPWDLSKGRVTECALDTHTEQ